jgi:hypothetical protein
MATKIGEDSEFTVPLKNLLGLVAATAIGVWAYFGIIERLTLLEMNQARIEERGKQAQEWMRDFEPSPEVRHTAERVRLLELKIVELETQLKLKGD